MTDRRPDPPDDPLLARLAGWFDQEVRQAAADLHAAHLAPARTRPAASRSPVAPVAAAILVVIVVLAGLTRLPGVTPGTRPTGTPGATIPGASAPSSAVTSPGTTGDTASGVGSRYPDGIPSSLGGRYVSRPSNIERNPSNDASFLLGGWSFDFSAIAYACPIQIGTPPPFGPRCGTPFLADQPLMNDAPRVLLDGWTAAIPAGAVILQVHRDDARSARCTDDLMCRRIGVVEKIVWTGDAVTAAFPTTAPDAFTRLVEADANLPQAILTPVGLVSPTGPGVVPGPTTSPDTVARPAGLDHCRPNYPAQAWTVQGSWIGTVLVFPTTADREAVDQDFLANGFVGTTTTGASCETIIDGLGITTWVAVDNVMVGVQTLTTSLAPWLRPDAVRGALTR